MNKTNLMSKQNDLSIEQWPIEKVIPYARNARKIPQSAINKVAGSIQEFSWRQPIVVDSDGVIVAGHTRLLAAQKLGLKAVPVHVASDLSPTQIKAYRLVDNRVADESSFDNALLALHAGVNRGCAPSQNVQIGAALISANKSSITAAMAS